MGEDPAGVGGMGATNDAGEPPAPGHPDVPLPEGVNAMFPWPTATEVCPDPELRVEFDSPPSLGNGRIEVFAESNPNQPVASADVTGGNVMRTLGGNMFTLENPVRVAGNAVVVQLGAGALDYGGSYVVKVESGAIVRPGGEPFVTDDASPWRFETAGSAPAAGELRVALDGSGQFCSVQGALDAVPENNDEPVVITVGEGDYYGVVYFTRKNKITLRGADRAKTRILGTNNNNMNPSTRGRALFGVDKVSDFVVENLTIHNLTPQGGSQAEALRVQDCDRCIVRQADILSLQDTLLWSGKVYAEECLIAGNVDYVWGTGAAYFSRCEIRTVGRKGYIVQARNTDQGYGYVFVDSKLTSDPGITDDVLARVDSNVYPSSNVAYIDCEMGSHIGGAGWVVTGGGTQNLRFWEYGSKKPDGSPVDTSKRASGSKQLSADEAAEMRDPSHVLGGWDPLAQ